MEKCTVHETSVKLLLSMDLVLGQLVDINRYPPCNAFHYKTICSLIIVINYLSMFTSTFNASHLVPSQAQFIIISSGVNLWPYGNEGLPLAATEDQSR